MNGVRVQEKGKYIYMPVIGLDDLSRKEAQLFFWATWWRGLILTLGGALTGFLVGVIGGIVFIIMRRVTDGALDAPRWLQISIEMPIVLGVSAYLGWQWWRWLFRINLAGYRLRLVKVENEL